jgi:hypothetical protein
MTISNTGYDASCSSVLLYTSRNATCSINFSLSSQIARSVSHHFLPVTMVSWLSVMHPLLALGAIHLAAAAPSFQVRLDSRNTNSTSTNGGAGKCIEKVVEIQASAMNTMLKYDSSTNQSMVTETIVEFLRKSPESITIAKS